MPHSRPRRHHQLAKISEESMTVDERERQPLLQQVKSRENVYQDADLPEDWCFAYKWGIVALLAFMAFTV
jgi:pyridoxine/pyridoxamine 5'-phosphate oxidase